MTLIHALEKMLHVTPRHVTSDLPNQIHSVAIHIPASAHLDHRPHGVTVSVPTGLKRRVKTAKVKVKVAEVSAALGTSTGTVSSTIQQGRTSVTWDVTRVTMDGVEATRSHLGVTAWTTPSRGSLRNRRGGDARVETWRA